MNSSLFLLYCFASILQLSMSLPTLERGKRATQNAEQALVDSIISIRFASEIMPLENLNLLPNKEKHRDMIKNMAQIYKLKEEIEKSENDTTTDYELKEYRVVKEMMELVLNQLCTWLTSEMIGDDLLVPCSAQHILWLDTKLEFLKRAQKAMGILEEEAINKSLTSFDICTWLKNHVVNNKELGQPLKSFIKDNNLYAHCRLFI